MNLSTWICLASAIPQALTNVISHQNEGLLAQDHDICRSTCDDLINDIHPLSLATGLVENKVFHLGQMLRQDDRKQFAKAMETKINGHVKDNH